MAKTKVLICPYCGETQPAGDRCRGCGGLFDPLSRQATHNAMGPWFIRDEKRLFHPGCSYETLVKLIDRGIVDRYTLLRGPTTKQYWTVAKHAAGISHLLGYCHNCDASVDPGDHGCHACGVPFGAYLDRNYMGLPDIKPLPWESDEAEDAQGAVRGVVTWADDTPIPQPGAGAPDLGGGPAASTHGTPMGRPGARISSFATNEELLQSNPGGAGNGSRSGPVAGSTGASSATKTAARDAGPDTLSTAEAKSAPAAMTTPAPSTGPTAAPATAPATAPAVAETTEPFATHPVARSMRRRIEKQRRTIRQLTVMAVVLGVLCVLLATPMLMDMMGGDSAPSDARGDNATQPSPGGNGTVANPNDTGNSASVTNNDAVDDDSAMTIGADISSGAPPTIGDDLQAPPIDDVDSGGDSDLINDTGNVDQLRHATDLLHAARDKSRSAEARLADARAALETLRTVAADPRTSPDLEAQLNDEIVKTETLVKELETIIFFDDD